MEKLYSAKELSEILNVSIMTIRRWTWENKIPHIKLSKRLVRYRYTDVIKALNRRRTEISLGG